MAQARNHTGAIALLADGVGGHQAGEVASRFVCENLKHWFEGRQSSSPSLDAARQEFRQAILATHAALHRLSRQKPEYQGMATTLAAALQHGVSAILVWAGDSRIYRERQGRLEQLSSDHNLLEERRRQGEINAGDAGLGNVITSSLGGTRLPRLGLETVRLNPGDRLLLISDGINKILEDGQIAALLPAGPEALVEAALGAQSGDDCSAVVVEARRDWLRWHVA